jgi:hypothetical protein
MSMKSSLISPASPTMLEWPKLTYAEWKDTRDTLHMWTQIVGKTRLMLEPLINHWWNVTLYVTPVGLTTSSMPYNGRALDIEFDFLSHRLILRTSEGWAHTIGLYPRSVADFYAEYMLTLQSLGIDIELYCTPQECEDRTPFYEDHHHASYDREYVERFRQVLIHSDRALKKFRAGFIGKCSPVHFFWGSFDLAVTRFSGHRAPERPNADRMTREAYSHEVSSCGFWPGDGRLEEAAFYAYAAPTPQGFADALVRPQAAAWNPQLGEFILKYDDVRTADSPESAILDFCQSTYEAAANLAQWDRASLER